MASQTHKEFGLGINSSLKGYYLIPGPWFISVIYVRALS